MIHGFFLDSHPDIPVFQLIISKDDLSVQPHVTLDTGFTGDIKVNPQTASDLGLQPIASEEVTVASGETIETPMAFALVSMEGIVHPVTVLVSPGSQLAGIGLFTKFGYKASVDCKNRTVELMRM